MLNLIHSDTGLIQQYSIAIFILNVVVFLKLSDQLNNQCFVQIHTVSI